jgi:solute carrier family 35 (UDP-sugar transporter), member A1/2/3
VYAATRRFQQFSVSCTPYFFYLSAVNATKTDMSVVPSIVALVALVVQNTALVFAMKLAFRDTAKSFHVSAVVLCAEAFKFCVCCAMSIFTRKSPGMTFKHLTQIFDHRMALPSLLYVVQNNILFVAVRHLTPTVYVACSQTKVLATVFFSVTFLNVKLTIRQIVAVFLLTAAMIFLQLPESNPVSDAHLVRKSSQVTGIAAVFCSSGISGFASVYMERLLKARDGDFTLFEQNIQLGLFSLPLASLAGLLQGFKLYKTTGFFHGFDVVIYSVIFLQAVGGLIVAAVVKFASSIMKCYAISASICLVAIVSCSLGIETMSSNALAGICLTVTSVHLFTKSSVSP